jgi:hypothetical protein
MKIAAHIKGYYQVGEFLYQDYIKTYIFDDTATIAQILRVTGQRSICDCNLSDVEEVKADERMQKFIKSAKMVYKMGSCSDVPCADCPWYDEHMHSTFRAEPDYDRSELDSKNARRRVAARWLIAHDITEVDGEPIVVEPPQILEPQKKDKE